MPRYHVHLIPTDPSMDTFDMAITVSLDADSDLIAQNIARMALALQCDVEEIELEEDAA
jgi:hypothetical protein